MRIINHIDTKKPRRCLGFLNMVGMKRLELLHLAAPEPKSGASTNFATSPNMAEDKGFEPLRTVLETVMLPLHQSSSIKVNFDGGGEETRTLTPCGAGT